MMETVSFQPPVLQHRGSGVGALKPWAMEFGCFGGVPDKSRPASKYECFKCTSERLEKYSWRQLKEITEEVSGSDCGEASKWTHQLLTFKSVRTTQTVCALYNVFSQTIPCFN